MKKQTTGGDARGGGKGSEKEIEAEEQSTYLAWDLPCMSAEEGGRERRRELVAGDGGGGETRTGGEIGPARPSLLRTQEVDIGIWTNMPCFPRSGRCIQEQ